MPRVLTTASKAQCMHGGFVVLQTTNNAILAGGVPVLLETDIHDVLGCPFVIGTTNMPCLKVKWEVGATSLTVGKAGVLTMSSKGTCLNAAGAPQGLATVSNPASELEAT